ncbi:hypothetical protein LLE49_21960 [Alicyclobacillus tolerans]|uniref:hypothetical protein n=1 Tax=Alicyclobacillus tolerans TaxID=90970 RepID=UPI001F2AD64E|nr:hypothetical protein [Alicyclobacillus tolerans]MCF8567391.1 hypothetical protein [Alicyclobacillus tolerans]
MEASNVRTIEPGRYIQFPNVPNYVEPSAESEFYHQHLALNFGSVSVAEREQNNAAAVHRSGKIISEFPLDSGNKLRFVTMIGFKTVAMIVNSRGEIVTDTPNRLS